MASFKSKGSQLPGFASGDKGDFTYHLSFPDNLATFEGRKNGDGSNIYHYKFMRASKDHPWKMQKAWRTDQHDHITEEYVVP
jgi:hypothetical protein